jgi:C-terminal processing protease CtpA/Prc
VTRVQDGRAAARVGVRVGDVVVGVDEQPIRSERDLRVNLLTWKNEPQIRVDVVRDHEPRVLTASPESLHGLAVPPAAPPAQEQSARELMERRIALEIERLERRLAELRKELQELRDRP